MNDIQNLPPVLQVSEVAAYLNLHYKTVCRYVREGKIRAAKCGRSYRIRREWLIAFLESASCKE